MRASRTSCLSSDVLGGLLDELEKIAETEQSKKVKHWLKNTAIVAAGTGAGTGAMMITEKALSSVVGPHWATMSPTSKKLIVGSLIGLSSVGAGLAAKKLFEERQKSEGG